MSVQLSNSRNKISNVRRIFLDFLTSMFSQDTEYTWYPDKNQTKIVISNEYVSGDVIAEKYPKIIVKRNDAGARNITIDRSAPQTEFLRPDYIRFKDLVSGSVAIVVLAQTQYESETIAEKIWQYLLVYRHSFKRYIHKFRDVSLGAVGINQADSNFRIYSTTVYASFDIQIDLDGAFSYYDVNLTVNGDKKYQYIDFYIYKNKVYFLNTPSADSDIKLDYLRMDNEVEVLQESPQETPDGEITTFTFDNNIFGPYYMLDSLSMDLEGPQDALVYEKPNIFDNVEINQDGGPVIYRIGHTYGLPGDIVPYTDSNTYITPFFVSVTSGQTIRLVKSIYDLLDGGDVTCHIYRNDNIIPTLSGINVTTDIGSTNISPVYLVDGDKLRLEVVSTTGSPKNLTFTIFLEYIQ